MMLIAFLFCALAVAVRGEVVRQDLPRSIASQHVGVTNGDFNNDGKTDILIAAGRHGTDQPFILINKGPASDGTSVLWSDPLYIGQSGGYYQADAYKSPDGVWYVLLVGGSGSPGITPARLYRVSIVGGDCSAECSAQWTKLWEDPNPRGDRNGGFAPLFTSPSNLPAIVLAGVGGATIFEPDSDGTYSTACFQQAPHHKRFAGFSVGSFGGRPGAIFGSRSSWNSQTNHNSVIVASNAAASGCSYEGGNGIFAFGGERVSGKPLQGTGVSLADLDGDGHDDILEANYGHSSFPQRVYFYNAARTSSDPWFSNPITLTTANGRTVTSGQVYTDSPFPDIIIGTSDDRLLVFANLGNRQFELREEISVGGSSASSVRAITVANLLPGYTSIVCAIVNNVNSAFHIPLPVTASPTDAPTESPTKAPTSSPTNSPTTNQGNRFDWGEGCSSGSGSFEFELKARHTILDVGMIPKGKFDIRIDLEASTDIDIQIYDLEADDTFEEGRAIVAWCGNSGCNLGDINGPAEEETFYEGMRIRYSGYNGVNGQLGNEFISISGEVTRNLMMRVYAYQTGTSTVNYSWQRSQTPCCQGTAVCTGSFEMEIEQNEIVSVGTIPKGKRDVQVRLSAPTDIDVQLYDLESTENFEEGKAIVAWCHRFGCNLGVLGRSPTLSTAMYRDRTYEYIMEYRETEAMN